MPFTIYMCLKCGKIFSTKEYCQDHSIVEHSSEARLCSNCNKKFPDEMTLAHHMTAHSTNAHSCNICGELCKAGLTLYIHLITCHKHKENIVCDICQNTFSDKQSLSQHLLNRHARKIPFMVHTAESCCTIHSSRSFPDEDLLLDPLIPRDIFEKFSQAVSEKHSESVELKGVDARSDGAKFDELLPKSTEVTHTVSSATSKQVKPHRDEVELVDDSPETLVQSPSRLLDTCDPERELNSTVEEHSATGHDTLSLGGRIEETQPESIPEYLHFLSSVDLPFDEAQYICEVCGMKFADPTIFLQSHFPLDVHF